MEHLRVDTLFVSGNLILNQSVDNNCKLVKDENSVRGEISNTVFHEHPPEF